MSILLFLSTIIIIIFFYLKWIDVKTLFDVCFYNLIVEMLFSFIFLVYIYYSDFLFLLFLFNFNNLNFMFDISFIFFFDEISLFFFLILNFCILLCFFFLIEYFEYDSNNISIIYLSSLFSNASIWFFSSYDLFLIIFFWELISLISFFLIQFWCYRLPSYKASIKVFLISQLGDIPFFIFIFLLINRFCTTDLTEILSQVFFLSFEYYFLESLGLLLNYSAILNLMLMSVVLLKSAQFFFYPWLLDAMEAPVPISAQLHSSTLVIIGIYLFFRFQNLIIQSPFILKIYIIVGCFTIVFSSILGFFQDDGKKLLACSTGSQLGYVILGVGLTFFEESLLMLFFCCCNKAITFVWFGILMDRLNGVSDLRIIGGSNFQSWVEHAGIAISVFNFTVMPGIFCWQIKSLYNKGQFLYDFFFIKYCFDVISILWFFSSLYFFYLYFSLFLKVNKSILTNYIFYKQSSKTFSINYFFHYIVNITLGSLKHVVYLDNFIMIYINIKLILLNINNNFFLNNKICYFFFFYILVNFIILFNSEFFFLTSLFDINPTSSHFFLDLFFVDFFNL